MVVRSARLIRPEQDTSRRHPAAAALGWRPFRDKFGVVGLEQQPASYYRAAAARAWRLQAEATTRRRKENPGGEAMPTKTPEKKASGGKANALQKPLQPSEELAAVVGSGPLPRGQVVSKMWDYIRSHNLQNPENRREILADDKLRKVFGKDKVTMFEMNKHLAQHLK